MTKNKDTKQDLDAKPVKEPIELTEWQKRNIEFLKKQKEKAAEEKKQKEKLLLEKKATVLHQSDDLSSQSEDKENIKDSSLGQEAQENQEASQVEEELTQNYEESQDLTKAKKPKRIKHRKKEKSKGQQAFIKSLPVLLISLLVLSLSLFLLSPYSKMKEFSAKGNKHVTLTELIEQSQIKSSDYFFKVAFSSARFAENVKLSNPWIKKISLDYKLPIHFMFNVTEYDIIAYAQVENSFQPILENGRRVAVINKEKLPKSYLIINLENEKDIQDLIKSLTKLPDKLVKDIKSVSLANSSSTKDLLVLELHDGNTIRVPQSEIVDKLPYYLKIKKSLTQASIVDMEVGIYSTTQDIEAQDAKVQEEKPEALVEQQASGPQATNPENPPSSQPPSPADSQEQVAASSENHVNEARTQ